MCSKTHQLTQKQSDKIDYLINLVDDPPLVLGFLEVRVREEEEHFLELALLEEVGQVLHRVRPQAGDVCVATRILKSERSDPILNVIRYLDSDFHSDHKLVREHGG